MAGPAAGNELQELKSKAISANQAKGRGWNVLTIPL